MQIAASHIYINMRIQTKLDNELHAIVTGLLMIMKHDMKHNLPLMWQLLLYNARMIKKTRMVKHNIQIRVGVAKLPPFSVLFFFQNY